MNFDLPEGRREFFPYACYSIESLTRSILKCLTQEKFNRRTRNCSLLPSLLEKYQFHWSGLLTGNSIGRITEGLLQSVSEVVDIVEPISKFSDNLKGKEGVGKIFNVGLEDWLPSPDDAHYDLIWNQWCLGHLTDTQLIVYLEKCSKMLNHEGWIVVKENMSTSGEDLFDDLDSSVTRYFTLVYFRQSWLLM